MLLFIVATQSANGLESADFKTSYVTVYQYGIFKTYAWS